MPPSKKELCTLPFLVIVELYIREGKILATGWELERNSPCRVCTDPEDVEPGKCLPAPPTPLLPRA